MRIVFDTNVLIAAFISRGVCADLLEHCAMRHTIVSSDFILAELQKHLAGKLKYTDEEALVVDQLLRSQLEVVTPIPLAASVCRDQDDDWILATAIAGNVACVVTGDKDLLALGQYEGIAIVRPSDFVDFESAAN